MHWLVLIPCRLGLVAAWAQIVNAQMKYSRIQFKISCAYNCSQASMKVNEQHRCIGLAQRSCKQRREGDLLAYGQQGRHGDLSAPTCNAVPAAGYKSPTHIHAHVPGRQWFGISDLGILTGPHLCTDTGTHLRSLKHFTQSSQNVKNGTLLQKACLVCVDASASALACLSLKADKQGAEDADMAADLAVCA